MNALWLVVVALAVEVGNSSFRTGVEARLDPVFGDTAGLQSTVDRSIALETEMQRVADQFSQAVHETLAGLARAQWTPGRAEPRAEQASTCGEVVAAAYARARAAGTRYLGLGRELDSCMREIRAAAIYGDTVGLTPDYRRKVEQSQRNHGELLRGFREMQAVFHDQLAGEMHYAGCETPSGTDADFVAADRADHAAGAANDQVSASSDLAKSPAAVPAFPGAAPPSPGGSLAPIAGIEIDSSRCPEASQVMVDGKAVGVVEGSRRTLVRLAEGPHDICVLPSSDARACGQSGTVRHAYVHDGWVLQVRCSN